jgi:polyhydroxyalkanoate synthesis regulator protein
MSNTPNPSPTVVIKRYAGRRLYTTKTAAYVTVDELREMAALGIDLAVYEADTGEEITDAVLATRH